MSKINFIKNQQVELLHIYMPYSSHYQLTLTYPGSSQLLHESPLFSSHSGTVVHCVQVLVEGIVTRNLLPLCPRFFGVYVWGKWSFSGANNKTPKKFLAQGKMAKPLPPNTYPHHLYVYGYLSLYTLLESVGHTSCLLSYTYPASTGGGRQSIQEGLISQQEKFSMVKN